MDLPTGREIFLRLVPINPLRFENRLQMFLFLIHKHVAVLSHQPFVSVALVKGISNPEMVHRIAGLLIPACLSCSPDFVSGRSFCLQWSGAVLTLCAQEKPLPGGLVSPSVPAFDSLGVLCCGWAPAVVTWKSQCFIKLCSACQHQPVLLHCFTACACLTSVRIHWFESLFCRPSGKSHMEYSVLFKARTHTFTSVRNCAFSHCWPQEQVAVSSGE